MKQVIVYKKMGIGGQAIKCKDLKEGHEIFNEIFQSGKYEYIELGIDKIDVDGTYKIVRSIRK